MFDGFSLVGKIILLYIVEFFFVLLWSILLLVPGIIAAYRYRFAIYNLCENPGIGLMEAIAMEPCFSLIIGGTDRYVNGNLSD